MQSPSHSARALQNGLAFFGREIHPAKKDEIL